MGRWDRELIPLLPKSVKIMASAGAGYDWADVDVFAEHGMCLSCLFSLFFFGCLHFPFRSFKFYFPISGVPG